MTTFKYWEHTELEVIDFVTAHMLKQGVRSLAADGDCVYRNSDGLMCAAGCLLPDGAYTPIMERKVWPELVTEHGMSAQHIELIRDMQRIHDNFAEKLWPKMLAEMRSKYS
jgi:hypothetical protein